MKKLIGLFVLILALCGCSSKESIDLKPYMNVTYTGINTKASVANVSVDKEKFKKDFPDFDGNLNDLEYVAPETKDLSNGDNVSVEIKGLASENYDISNKIEFEVSDLKNSYGFNDKILFDGFEITFKDKVKTVVDTNAYSDNKGKKVVKIPLKIKNTKNEKGMINMFYYEAYGPKGETKLDNASAYFDDKTTIDWGGDILPGKSATRYMYYVKEGSGVYKVFFDNWTDKIEVELNIK
ncbi:hypothetical protein [Mycoplasma sp. P36-A1]|uniref:hypothetical protein n=1 Tax=Mycoplasma sp. P36-A1 TaxID=3252900 RepID=UPI003C2F3A05